MDIHSLNIKELSKISISQWYKHSDSIKEEIDKYIHAINNIPDNNDIIEELENYFRNSIYRLIFESNLIENAGTKTFDETKRIILENCKDIEKIENTYIFNHIPNEQSLFPFVSYYHNLMQKKIDNSEPLIINNGKSKEEREVLQHFQAIDIANQNLSDFANKISQAFFTQDKIKFLHKIIAKDLLPDDVPVPAGEYRNYNNITIGNTGLIFPAAELLDQSMEVFCNNSNNLLNELLDNKIDDAYYAAAKISYDFVRIHPFSNFNGRISRILMNMVLWANNIPFAIALRGNKKEKHKYIVSLQRADNNDLIPYSALIAKRVLDTFREFDENIVLAGYPSILKLT